MLPKKLAKELNDQVTYEYDSAWIYLQMEQYFSAQNLEGFAHFFHKQAQEEGKHARKFVEYLVERAAPVTYGAMSAPKATFTSIKAVFEAALKHEQFISARIEKLMNLAKETKDHASEIMLQWFVSEQVEEENSMQKVIDTLALVGNSGGSLFMLDRQLGKRE